MVDTDAHDLWGPADEVIEGPQRNREWCQIRSIAVRINSRPGLASLDRVLRAAVSRVDLDRPHLRAQGLEDIEQFAPDAFAPAVAAAQLRGLEMHGLHCCPKSFLGATTESGATNASRFIFSIPVSSARIRTTFSATPTGSGSGNSASSCAPKKLRHPAGPTRFELPGLEVPARGRAAAHADSAMPCGP